MRTLSGLGSARIMKNCDLGLENAALGLQPRAAFLRPWSQCFAIRTSQPANYIYVSFNQATQYTTLMVKPMKAMRATKTIKSERLLQKKKNYKLSTTIIKETEITSQR